MQRGLCAALLTASMLGTASCKARVPDTAIRDVPVQAAPARPTILNDVPTAPGGYLTDTSSTSDAEHRSYSVPHPIDTVAAFYRDRLKERGWSLMSDRADQPAGKIDLLVTKDSLSLWVHLERNGDQAALVSLIAHRAETPATAGGAGRRTP